MVRIAAFTASTTANYRTNASQQILQLSAELLGCIPTRHDDEYNSETWKRLLRTMCHPYLPQPDRRIGTKAVKGPIETDRGLRSPSAP